MKTSKDVGLVVVGADLVGLVDANTHLVSRRSAPTAAAVRGREPPPLLPRSLVRILPLSSSDILVLKSFGLLLIFLPHSAHFHQMEPNILHIKHSNLNKFV